MGAFTFCFRMGKPVPRRYNVDLAGCEKVKRSEASGSRLDEACGAS
jgi:hypothetical protein